MSPRPSNARRGQPIVVLALVMASWVGFRSVVWAADTDDAVTDHGGRPLTLRDGAPVAVGNAAPSAGGAIVTKGRPDRLRPVAPITAPTRFVPVAPPAWLTPTAPVVLGPPTAAPVVSPPVAGPRASSPRVAAGHQLLYMAGLAQLPMLPLGGAGPVSQPARREAAPASRWSGDGWLLLRRGGNGFNLPGAGLPGANLPSGAYGASQAGAVIRYRLAPASSYRPSLYLRATSALHSPRGEEVAAGLSVRPLPRVPLAAMVEARATRTMTGTVVRPAAAVVSELPPVDLPLGLRGEAYVQAGYVGGRGATAFADGQARLERRLVSAGRWQLRAGGGTWGGAQKGAKRLDVGPTATLDVPLGPINGRLAADWRFRVAGNAAPTSGPALTLSAGF